MAISEAGITSADIRDAQETFKQIDFIYEVLRLMDETDCYHAIWWRCTGEFAPVTFFVNCNDLFEWATADCETLTPDDLPALQTSIAEVREIDKKGEEDHDWGFLLWCARKRQMRPQQPAYPNNERLRALFDACGPVHTRTEER